MFTQIFYNSLLYSTYKKVLVFEIRSDLGFQLRACQLCSGPQDLGPLGRLESQLLLRSPSRRCNGQESEDFWKPVWDPCRLRVSPVYAGLILLCPCWPLPLWSSGQVLGTRPQSDRTANELLPCHTPDGHGVAGSKLACSPQALPSQRLWKWGLKAAHFLPCGASVGYLYYRVVVVTWSSLCWGMLTLIPWVQSLRATIHEGYLSYLTFVLGRYEILE